MTLKIGILSDSHGWIHPDIISLMNTCDQIIHAGDIIEDINVFL
jgi:predicted phosphodiesterase